MLTTPPRQPLRIRVCTQIACIVTASCRHAYRTNRSVFGRLSPEAEVQRRLLAADQRRHGLAGARAMGPAKRSMSCIDPDTLCLRDADAGDIGGRGGAQAAPELRVAALFGRAGSASRSAHVPSVYRDACQNRPALSCRPRADGRPGGSWQPCGCRRCSRLQGPCQAAAKAE